MPTVTQSNDALSSLWIEGHGLELATATPEGVPLTKIPAERTRMVGDALVQTEALGLMLDNKLTFSDYILRAAGNATTVTEALSRVIANVNFFACNNARCTSSCTPPSQ